jgi:hypothetical protein
MGKGKDCCTSFGGLDSVSLCDVRWIVGITEQRAINSKVSADGIGVVGAMVDSRGWWGLRSGARIVRKRFKRREVIWIILPFRHVACLWRIPGPRTTAM